MVLAAKALNGTTAAIYLYSLIALCPDFSPVKVATVYSILDEHLDGCRMGYMRREDTKAGECSIATCKPRIHIVVVIMYFSTYTQGHMKHRLCLVQ